MNEFNSVRALLLMPFWILQIGTSAKSFIDNPVLGSQRLNRWGLHRCRVRFAAAMCRYRRSRLASRVRQDWREEFDRTGYVAIHEVIPASEFSSLRKALLEYRGMAREMRQGDAITRRLAVDHRMLAAIPGLRELLARRDLRALFHYVSSFRIEPLHYVQTIVTHDGQAEAQVGEGSDPQELLHADAFHSSMKAWLFLNPVEQDEAPFTYVPGSHRNTQARMDWEYRRSLVDPRSLERLSARGSPRAKQSDLDEMDLPTAVALSVPANTLIVADTGGFHARGPSARPVERVEIWSYSRRNPFLPWLGWDLLSLPGIAERRVTILWALRDKFEGLLGQPWKKAGERAAVQADGSGLHHSIDRDQLPQ